MSAAFSALAFVFTGLYLYAAWEGQATPWSAAVWPVLALFFFRVSRS